MSAASTSRSLLARARAREAVAWERILELYAPLVLFWIRSSGLRGDDAADVLQDVFHAASSHIEGFRRDREGDSFRAWLRTLARTKVADAFRKRERLPAYVSGSELARCAAERDEPSSVVSATGPDVAAPLERALQADLLRRALVDVRARVQPNTFRAFELTVLDGRSPDSVADELGMTAGGVRVAKSRVLQRLRAALGDLEPA